MKYLILALFFQIQIVFAGTIKCPTPPTAIAPEVQAKVSFDKKTGLYKYQYTVSNKSDAKVPIWAISLKTLKPVEKTITPALWKCNDYSNEHMSIYCRRESLTNKEIKPGETLSGFEFTSKEPPGLVKFYAYGKPDGLQTVIADTPGEGEDESEFICPGFFYDGFESDVTLVTLGPLPANQVDVKLRMKKLKDKKWQGKHDDEAKLEVSPLDIDKVQVILFDDKEIDTSKIKLDSLEFGFGKAKPIKTYFISDFKDEADDEIKEHVKKHRASHLVMEFDLAAVNVRCDVDRALFLTGKVDTRNLFGAVKIKHLICDMKTFNKHPKKKKDKKKNNDDDDDLSEE